MKRLPRFWKALAELPGAETDAREWRGRLGDEFPLVARFLRASGALVRSVDCPSPGGDHCPRRVIANGDGTYRAVCQSPEVGCETLTLSKADIAVLALDRRRLLEDLAQLFEVQAIEIGTEPAPAIVLGKHEIAAGFGASVIVVLPSVDMTVTIDDLRRLGLTSDPAVILEAGPARLPPQVRSHIISLGHQILDLGEVAGIDRNGKLSLTAPVSMLLAQTLEQLHRRKAGRPAAPHFLFPPGTTWEQCALRLTSLETLAITVGSTTYQVDPDQLGLRSRKNHRRWPGCCSWPSRLGDGSSATRRSSASSRSHRRKRNCRESCKSPSASRATPSRGRSVRPATLHGSPSVMSVL
jgi:hypothetical protein